MTLVGAGHSMTHFLARTYVAELVPIEYLHATHKTQGLLFFVLAVLHTLGHLIRWGVRGEMQRMFSKTVGVSGIIAMLLMCVIVAPMAIPPIKRRLSFELRIDLHAGRVVEVLLLASLLAHATRAGVITLCIVGVWGLDKLYMLLFRTFRLEVVELTRLDDGAEEGRDKNADAVGVQMLWRNPDGFEPVSGEYVLVQFPWLEKGGDEWHPFSMYMREATAEGLSIARRSSGRTSCVGGGRVHRKSSLEPRASVTSSAESRGSGWGKARAGWGKARAFSKPRQATKLWHAKLDEASGRYYYYNDADGETVTSWTLPPGSAPAGATGAYEAPADEVGGQEENTEEQAVTLLMDDLDTSGIDEEARGADHDYDTTQVFIMPAGDWTRSLSEELKGGVRRHRSCWIRGPYTSPFTIAHDFSQLLLFASGIGITPSLGVLGQYRGAKRVKFLIWVTRSASMLKFFAPLICDAQVATVYYTGKPALTEAEVDSIERVGKGKIFIHQRRPKLVECFARTIIAFESAARGQDATEVEDIDSKMRASWCALYCGGSKRIETELSKAARKFGVGWQAELFDW